MIVHDNIKQQRQTPILVVDSSRFDSCLLKAVRAEQLARRIELVTAAEDTHCSAKAVVINPLGQILVLKDAGGEWHDLPGGRIHEGEDAVTALAREVREETGLSIGDIKLGETINFKAGKVPHTTLLFKANALSLDVRLSDEHSDHAWVEPKDLGNYTLGLLLAPMQRLLNPVAVQASAHKPLDERTRYANHIAAQNEAEEANRRAMRKALVYAEVAVQEKKAHDDEDGVLAFLLLLMLAGAGAAYAAAYRQMARAAGTTGVATQAQEDHFAAQRGPLLKPFLKRVVTELELERKRGEALDETPTEIARRLSQTAEGLEASQGERVAQAEGQAAYGSANLRILEKAGFATVAWVTMDDERVRDSHRQCEEAGPIPIGHVFPNGLRYPGDPNGGPEEVCGCRCWLVGVKRKSE